MWFLFVVISIICTATYILLSRHYLTHDKHLKSYTILWEIAIGICALFLTPFFSFYLYIDIGIFLLLLTSSSLYSLSNFFRVEGFRVGEVSLVSSVLPIGNLFTMSFSILFFGASLNAFVLIGFLIIIFSSYVINLDKGKLHLKPGIKYFLSYAILSGIAVSIDAYLIHFISVPLYLFLSNILQAILSLWIFLRPRESSMRDEIKRGDFKILIPAIFLCLGSAFYLQAFNLGSTIQVIATRSLLTIVVTLLAIYFFKEKQKIKLKIIMAIIATVGILIINL